VPVTRLPTSRQGWLARFSTVTTMGIMLQSAAQDPCVTARMQMATRSGIQLSELGSRTPSTARYANVYLYFKAAYMHLVKYVHRLRVILILFHRSINVN